MNHLVKKAAKPAKLSLVSGHEEETTDSGVCSIHINK